MQSVTSFVPDTSLISLKWWANKIAGHYACPVILGGSAMYNDCYRDVDVFAVMPDSDFEIRFGDVGVWVQEGDTGSWGAKRWLWSEECIKRWREGCKETNLNLDFKIIPASYHLITCAHLIFMRLDNGPAKMPELKPFKTK